MKQQTVLIEEQINTLKPSQLLRQAHYRGISQCKNRYRNGNSYCAMGALARLYGNSKGYELDDNLPTLLNFVNDDGNLPNKLWDELFALGKYNKMPSELTLEEKKTIGDVIYNLVLYNDSSPNITFLDCANFLEKFGL
jgi:hypothetical protein